MRAVITFTDSFQTRYQTVDSDSNRFSGERFRQELLLQKIHQRHDAHDRCGVVADALLAALNYTVQTDRIIWTTAAVLARRGHGPRPHLEGTT